MASAYIVIDRLSVTDKKAFRAYSGPAGVAITRYGGRYILPQETEIEALQGNWRPNRIVVIEFEDVEHAR